MDGSLSQDTNGYGGTYLDLYLAEFTENLQGYRKYGIHSSQVIVIRPTEPVFCPLISASLSMKVVSNKYLLKNEK